MAKTQKETGSKEAEAFDYARFKQQAEKVRQSGFRRGYVSAEKKILKDGDNLLRLVGNSHDVLVGWVACSDGKRRPIRVADDSPLLKLYHEVTREEKQGEKKGKDGKMRPNYVPVHEHLPFFKTIENWRIRREFLWNCIDREDDWCKRNKHTKLLASSKYGEGFGPTIYQGRKGKGGITALIEEWGDPSAYDIKIEKSGQKMDTDYVVAKPNPARTKGVVSGALSAAEKAYGRYDLLEISAPTKPERLVEWIGATIKAVDAALGTDYLLQLSGEEAPKAKKEPKEKPVEIKRTKL